MVQPAVLVHKGGGVGGKGFWVGIYQALMMNNQAVTNRREFINRLAVLEERIGLLEHHEKKGPANETAGNHAPVHVCPREVVRS